jgi:hypothetical protein
MQRWVAPRAPKRRRAGFPALLRFRFVASAHARETGHDERDAIPGDAPAAAGMNPAGLRLPHLRFASAGMAAGCGT